MDIFEALDKKFNLRKQIYELNVMLFQEIGVFSNSGFYVTFSAMFDKNLLRTWQCSKGRISIEDLIQDLGINCIKQNAQPNDIVEALSCLQFDYNMIKYAITMENTLPADKNKRIKFFANVTNKIDYILNTSGYKFIKHPQNDYYIIVPQNSIVESAAITQNEDNAFLIYEFTSPLNKNNIKKKREILKLLSNNLYAIIAQYNKKYNSGLGRNILGDLSCILDNFEIRHPNLDPRKASDYKAKLEKYSLEDWEEIYDTAFQLVLHIILIDNYNENINGIVKKHKGKINIDR